MHVFHFSVPYFSRKTHVVTCLACMVAKFYGKKHTCSIILALLKLTYKDCFLHLCTLAKPFKAFASIFFAANNWYEVIIPFLHNLMPDKPNISCELHSLNSLFLNFFFCNFCIKLPLCNIITLGFKPSIN